MKRALEGKRVLVTGAGARVGRAIAEGLGRAGAHIALHFHGSEGGAAGAQQAITGAGSKAEKFKADLTNPAEIDDLVEAVESHLGPLDALVNSAAIFIRAGFQNTPVEVLERQWALNARAPFLLTQRVAKGLFQRRQEGDVVNVLDIGGALVPWRNHSAYCMTKAAAAMLTKSLALELAPRVRVNAVAPGTVLPPEGTGADELEKLRSRIPQGRFGSPQDVVEAILFLLTGPRFMTGQILAVDGGRLLA